MASFFRFSCSIFWVGWMVSMSFFISAIHVQQRYSYVHVRSEISTFMLLACANMAIMSFLGCCCVKFEVTHVCCVIWYIMITTVMTLYLTVSVMVYIRSDSTKALHEEGEALRSVQKEIMDNGRLPDFIHFTQLQYGCCGVFGFKDYRAVLFPTETIQDVPHSCCKDVAEARKDRCSMPDGSIHPKKTLDYIFLNRSHKDYRFPMSILQVDNNDQGLINMLDDLYGSYEDFGPAPDRYLSPKLALPPNVSMVKLINMEGCYEHLRRNSTMILDCYFGFSLFLTGGCILMVITFARTCLQARRMTHESIEKEVLEAIERHENLKGFMRDPELEHKNTDELLKELKAPKKKLNVMNLTSEPKGAVKMKVPTQKKKSSF